MNDKTQNSTHTPSSTSERQKHTPAEWFIAERRTRGAGEIVALDIERKGQRIASVSIRPELPFEANAHLEGK